MEYRKLGASGVSVSPLCIGTMMFGAQTREDVAARIMSSARDAGVNFVDTADVYVKGTSEKVLGKLIRRQRDYWVLATKLCNPMGESPNQGGLGRKWMLRAIDDSLGRLGTDYVDIYYLHRDDPGTPLEEIVGTLGDLIRQGKIRYWGISNFSAWRIAEAVSVCDRMGVPRPAAVQPYYNALKRLPEVEVLPACAHFGIGVVSYSPVARGVLSGKYRPGAAPTRNTRAGRKEKRMMEAEFFPESLILAQKIVVHAERRGMTATQFAVNWVLNNGIVTSIIAGPRTYAQWTEYLGALEHGFTAKDEAMIDRLVPPGHASPPGFVDPVYPITGRAPRTGH